MWPFSVPQPWVGPFHTALSINLEAAMTWCKQDLREEQQLLVTLPLAFSGDSSKMPNHGKFTQRERLQYLMCLRLHSLSHRRIVSGEPGGESVFRRWCWRIGFSERWRNREIRKFFHFSYRIIAHLNQSQFISGMVTKDRIIQTAWIPGNKRRPGRIVITKNWLTTEEHIVQTH